MLTELALILALTVGAFVFAAGAGRWSLRRPSGSTEVRRLAEAAARASEAFMRQQNKRVALVTLSLGAGVVGAHAVAAWVQGRPFSPRVAAWSVVSLASGAVLAGAVAFVGSQLTLRAASRVFVAADSTLDHALALVVRTGGAVGILAEVCSVAATAGLFGMIYLSEGGPALDLEAVRKLVSQAAGILPAFGLGAVAASAVLQRGSTRYHASGSIGATLSDPGSAGIEPKDARHPALVADLIGEHAGLSCARTVDMFATSALGSVATWCLGVVLFTSRPASSAGFGVLTLPAVVRAVGLIATAFGLLAARTSDAESPARGLWRGQGVTIIVALGGSAGAAAWLARSSWPALSAAAAVGLFSSGALAHWARRSAGRRSDLVRAVSEPSNGGVAVSFTRGLALGLVRAFPLIGGAGAAICTAFVLGARDDGAVGGLLALSVALSSMLAGGGYMLALGISEPIVAGARNMSAVEPRSLSVETQRRAGQLEEAGFQASAASQTYFIVAGSIAALLAVYTLPLPRREDPLPGLALDNPMILLSGLLGSATILAFAGDGLAAAANAARAGAAEIARQLRGFPRQSGLVHVPPDHTPSYKTLVDRTSRLALEGGLFPVALAILAPAALGFSLRLMYTTTGLAIQGVSSFVVIAAATGLGMALVADGTRLVLNAAYRAERPRGGTSRLEATITGNAIADLMGSSVGPSALMAAKTVTAASLVVTTFLT